MCLEKFSSTLKLSNENYIWNENLFMTWNNANKLSVGLLFEIFYLGEVLILVVFCPSVCGVEAKRSIVNDFNFKLVS
jgi:hypothetical protein